VIYLDHHAAAPIGAAARAAMDAHLAWANPSSVHRAGRAARATLERAREEVAAAVGAEPLDLIFTAGGTEACNLGVLGVVAEPRCVITTDVEHPAVSAAVQALERKGAEVVRLPVVGGAPPAAERLEDALGLGADLVVMQWVNHETGTLMPVAKLAASCARAGVPMVIDATQALGKVPVDVAELGVTAAAFASHKIGGPGGAGALWVKRGVAVLPQLRGGAQERGRRSGTPDVRALAGFGAACRALGERLAAMSRVARRRDQLESGLLELGGVINGDPDARVSTVTNASFRGWRGDHLVAALDVEGLCAASGAACSSGMSERSPVIFAMYPREPWRSIGSLRLSLGPETEGSEVERALEILRAVVPRARPEA